VVHLSYISLFILLQIRNLDIKKGFTMDKGCKDMSSSKIAKSVKKPSGYANKVTTGKISMKMGSKSE
jgi:hypothetical protein